MTNRTLRSAALAYVDAATDELADHDLDACLDPSTCCSVGRHGPEHCRLWGGGELGWRPADQAVPS